MITQEQTSASGDASVIRWQLSKIAKSAPFVRSSRIVAFLTFVVENAIDGNLGVLKESCIGSMVFGREPDYDPKIDPIVRVEARRLRSKLQDYYDTEGAADTVFIQMPKGGYRPIIATRTVQGAALDKAAPPETPVSLGSDQQADFSPAIAEGTGPLRRPMVYALVAFNAVAILAGLAWMLQFRQSESGPLRRIRLTSTIGEAFDAALSPDGHHLAYVWNGGGSNYDIYVKAIANGDPLRITRSPYHDLHPAWSPDGRDLAFLRVTPTGSQVLIVPAAGGPERLIGVVNNLVSQWKADAMQMVGALGPAWSPDGKSVVIDDSGSIYEWPLSFGTRRQLTWPPGAGNDFYPAVSPDGSLLAFVRQTSNSTADLYVTGLTGDRSVSPRQLTTDSSDIHGIAWARDSKSIILSSARQGDYTLWQVDLQSGHMKAIPINGGDVSDPSLSPAGSLLAYAESVFNTNIWRMQIGPQADVHHPVRIIASSHRNNSPSYSPDGKQIAFISDRSGNLELWVCQADGSGPHQLTNFRGPLLGTPHWSPDGRWIAFDARPGGHSAIFVIPSAGGNLKQLSHNIFEERMPNWSMDGRFLYFSSTRSGEARLWKMTAGGEDPVQITEQPAYDSFEADSGRSVYFRGNGPGIWVVSSSGGTAKIVPPLSDVEASRYLAVTQHALYFVDHEDAPRHIKAYSFATHKVTTIGEIDHTLVNGTPSLSVSPDEQFILFAQQDWSESNIFAVPWKTPTFFTAFAGMFH